ncbi:MAG: histidine phosphatase family protein [bacterium]
MKFYFIRHAQSENNVLLDRMTDGVDHGEGNNTYLRSRYADAPVSELGKQQARLLGAFIGDKSNGVEPGSTDNPSSYDEFGFTHLYVSPMIRTLDTAMPVAAALNINPVVWEDLHEQGGVWTQDGTASEKTPHPGLDPVALKTRYPGFVVPSTMSAKGWWQGPYETLEACYLRAGRVWETLLKRHGETEDRVAVVSHGIFFNCFMFQLFGFSPGEPRFQFAIQNVSITRVDIDKRGKKLIYQNRVEFIPHRLLTG